MKGGQLVAERYELEELLGTGGMASVYTARDTLLERRVALKMLQDGLSDDPDYVERFRREAKAIAKLAHPNVVTVMDRGQFEGREYIVFEHVAGETLRDMIEREGPLAVEQALGLVRQIALGLAVAHARGVVHRDVKPENVLVDERGTAKVTDFGIARAVGTADAADTLTKAGTILGTSGYISPEQVLGRGLDERSDQYSLGVVLYELLTARVPYPGQTFMEVAARHVSDSVPSVRSLRRDVSPHVDALVRRAMAKRPDERFPSMHALIEALDRCLVTERARPPRERNDLLTSLFLLRWWPVSGPRLLALAAAVLVLVSVLIALVGGESDDDAKASSAPKAEAPHPLRLTAVRDYDPFGNDQEEHAEDVHYATDRNPSTYWTTERYRSFEKPGVGIVLDAGRKASLGAVEVLSDEPGFRAKIRAGNRRSGGFRDVSPVKTVGERTLFNLDTGGAEFRYYLLWITDPNGRAHVNEVRALR
jgi:serine/threonine protein kinase